MREGKKGGRGEKKRDGREEEGEEGEIGEGGKRREKKEESGGKVIEMEGVWGGKRGYDAEEEIKRERK